MNILDGLRKFNRVCLQILFVVISTAAFGMGFIWVVSIPVEAMLDSAKDKAKIEISAQCNDNGWFVVDVVDSRIYECRPKRTK